MKALETTAGTVTFDTPDTDELKKDAGFVVLYDAAFPADQREPIDVIVGALRSGRGLVVRARAAGKTIGLSSAHLLEAPPAVFLVYLAVAPEWRKHLIGSALFEHTWTQGAARLRERDLRPGCYLWEVERPELAGTKEEGIQARKRIAFFERMGGRKLFPGYQQPPVDGTHSVPMILMARSAGGHPLPATPDVVRAVYFEKYGGANGISPGVLNNLFQRVTKAN